MKARKKYPIILSCFLSTVVLWFISCNNKKVEITSTYIINEHWNEIANSIEVSRMKLKSNASISLDSLNQGDVVDNLEIDSSFRYFANVKSASSLTSKKVYFNNDNGFDWWNDSEQSKTKILGNLKINCWYRVSLDTYQNQIYIFIDSLNIVHRQDVVPTNF